MPDSPRFWSGIPMGPKDVVLNGSLRTTLQVGTESKWIGRNDLCEDATGTDLSIISDDDGFFHHLITFPGLNQS
jgi:hypothetical protein